MALQLSKRLNCRLSHWSYKRLWHWILSCAAWEGMDKPRMFQLPLLWLFVKGQRLILFLCLSPCVKQKTMDSAYFTIVFATTHDYSRKKHVGSLWFRSLRQSVFRGIQTFLFLHPEPMHSVRLQTLTLSVQADRVDCYCSQNLLSHVLLEFPM